MNVTALLISCGVSFFFLYVLFRPLEWAFPARQQAFFRPAWWTDLCFFLGQYLVFNGLVLGVLAVFAEWFTLVVPESFRAIMPRICVSLLT